MKHLISALCILSAGLLHAQVTTTAAVIDTKRSDGTFVEIPVTVLNSSVIGWSASGTLTRFGLGTGLLIDESGQLVAEAGSAATWGSITGTLSAQTDLQSALDAKLSTTTAASTYVSLAGSYSDPAWITGLAWSKISSTPTTLSGYGITDALASATAASTYVALAGGYSDPSWITSLAWSKISGTPTTLSGYGITDGLASATAASTYVALAGSYADPAWITSLAWSKISGAPTTLSGYGITDGLTSATAASTYVALAGSYADPTWITSLAWSKISGAPSLVTTFLGLTDTPASYSGQGGKVVAVKGDASGLEFVASGGTGTVTSVAIAGTDGLEVDSGSPITTSGTIQLGVNASTLKTHLSLGNVENTALSTWAGSTNLTTLGTITTGIWQGTNIDWSRVSKTGSSLADLATRSAGDLNSGTLPAARLPAPTTTALGGVKRNTGSAGQFVNGISTDGDLQYGTPSGGGGGASVKYAHLTGDVAVTNNSSLQNITGLSFAADANKAYDFQAEIVLVTSASGTGSHFGWTVPASPTLSVAHALIFHNTNATPYSGVTLATGEIASNPNGSTSERVVKVWGTLINGSTAGTVQITMRVETGVSGTVTAKAGSVLKYQEITTP